MQCVTIKDGVECAFMSKKGCDFIGGACRQIVEKCEGCDRVMEYPDGKYCNHFPDPSVKWRNGICNMATHMKVEVKGQAGKVRVGQQKQKKR